MERDILRLLHSRFGALFMMVISIVATIVSYCLDNISVLPGDTGLLLPPAHDWISGGALSLTVNLLLNVSIAAMMVLLNKRFNILRSASDLFAGLFLILQMSLPFLMGHFYGGTLLCAVVMFLIFILFASYNRPYPLQPIFLIFCVLMLCAMTQYAYIFYLPVFLIGCAQMRIFNIKTVLAAIIGVITPVWILWGFGIISFSNFEMPQFVNMFSMIDSYEMLQMIISVGLTLLLMLVFCLLNLIKVFNYNAKARAYNGFIAILSIITAILVLIDYNNLAIYIPMLNCCTAFQIGYYFANNDYQRSYIVIIGLIVAYVGLYWWSAIL